MNSVERRKRARAYLAGKGREATRNWDCYLFLLPFLLVFTLFVIAPVLMSMYYSFTYYNVLQPPQFVGWQNYQNLFVGDNVFLTALKNTFLIAIVTGPAGYLASLLMAWCINELSAPLRALMVTVMYAPSICGGAFMIWKVLFSGDAYGYLNGILMNMGLINDPVQWLTDTNYMLGVSMVVMLWMSLGSGFLSFVAGFQTIDKSMYEAGYVEGIRNRWQELWFITLPMMKPQLMFGAVMSITGAFSCGTVQEALFGNPSTDYAAHTLLNHMSDYGTTRFEMGYACAVATFLFVLMMGCNGLVQKLLRKVGT